MIWTPLVAAAVLAAGPPPDSVQLRIEVHEAYELANVTLALHDVVDERPWLALRSGPYWERIEARFGSLRRHPAVVGSAMTPERWVDPYYAIRNGGYRWAFEEDRLVREKGDLFWGRDGFAPLQRAMEDFARKSDFRRFFAENAGYYDDMVERYRRLVDFQAMAAWLEREFPATHIDRYTVILSPLVYGSHNTLTLERDGKKEAVMFVAGPDVPVKDDPAGYRRAANERVVFTEIDHNYVNPASAGHASRIRELFGASLAQWNRDRSGSYGSALRTFNEYMTWGVFLLYADEVYAADVARAIRERVVSQMEEDRGFTRFGDFQASLDEVWTGREAGRTVADLYPDILEALENVKRSTAAPDFPGGKLVQELLQSAATRKAPGDSP